MIPATQKFCWYQDGKHVYAGPNCPHDNEGKDVDETVPLGWTVQNAETSSTPPGR